MSLYSLKKYQLIFFIFLTPVWSFSQMINKIYFEFSPLDKKLEINQNLMKETKGLMLYDKDERGFNFADHRFTLATGVYLPIFFDVPEKKLNPNLALNYSINYSFNLFKSFIFGLGYRRIFGNKILFDDTSEIPVASLGGGFTFFHTSSYVIAAINIFSIDMGYQMKLKRLEITPKFLLLFSLSDYHDYDGTKDQWTESFKIDPIDLGIGIDFGYHLNKSLILSLNSFSNITPYSAEGSDLIGDNYPRLFLPSINAGFSYKLN